MSVKHVKQYYDKICNDYLEMLDVLHELEQEVSENIISQESIEQTIKSVDQLKDNYMRWSYMMYLLNLPNKKDKQKVYQKRLKKYMDTLPKNADLASVLEENKNCINNFKKSIHTHKTIER